MKEWEDLPIVTNVMLEYAGVRSELYFVFYDHC